MKKTKLKSKITRIKLEKLLKKKNIFKISEKYFYGFLDWKVKDKILENILLKYYSKNKIPKLTLKFHSYSINFNFENENYIFQINCEIYEKEAFIWEYYFNLNGENIFTS